MATPRQYVIGGEFGGSGLNETPGKQYVVPGSGINEQDAVAATLAKTLGAVTLASTATATDTVTGTLSKTLGAVTLSSTASATDSVVGTMAVTLGGVTLVSEATATLAVDVPAQPPAIIGGTVANRRGGRRKARFTIGDNFQTFASVPSSKAKPEPPPPAPPKPSALDWMLPDTAAGKDLASKVTQINARKAAAAVKAAQRAAEMAEQAKQFQYQQEALFLVLAAAA